MAKENNNHPLAKDGFIINQHYMQNKYQVIDILEDQLTRKGYMGFNSFMIIKYLLRADHNKPLEDYKKASYYLNNLIMYINKTDGIYAKDEAIKPNHYKIGNIEAIDIIEDQLDEEELKGAYLGVILKYIFRYKYKNGVADLEKANYYLNKMIKYFESKTPKKQLKSSINKETKDE